MTHRRGLMRHNMVPLGVLASAAVTSAAGLLALGAPSAQAEPQCPQVYLFCQPGLTQTDYLYRYKLNTIGITMPTQPTGLIENGHVICYDMVIGRGDGTVQDGDEVLAFEDTQMHNKGVPEPDAQRLAKQIVETAVLTYCPDKYSALTWAPR